MVFELFGIMNDTAPNQGIFVLPESVNVLKGANGVTKGFVKLPRQNIELKNHHPTRRQG